MYDNNDENYYSSDLSDNEDHATTTQKNKSHSIAVGNNSNAYVVALVLTSKFAVFSLE